MTKISSESILSKDTLTEKEMQLILKRLNAGEKIEWDKLPNYETQATWQLTADQTAKGIAWLKDQWQTPKGLERKTNPFGDRETSVIANFDHFELEQFYDAGNQYRKWYVPLYNCIAKDGSYFQYYVAGGKPVIIG